MDKLLFIGCGGFLGANARFLVNQLTARLSQLASFPFGTLIANLLGCLLIGFLYGLVESRASFGPNTRLFIFTGFLGGFTTFSSFALETANLMREQCLWAAFANMAVQLLAGLLLVFLGLGLAKLV